MSNRNNPRRGDVRRTETGPTWEGKNPGKGCNSTHVAGARESWKRIAARSARRTGKVSPKFHPMNDGRRAPLPRIDDDEE